MAKNKNNTVKVNNTTVPANPEAENKNTTVKNIKNARIFVSGRTITIDDAIKKKKERDERIRARRFNKMVKSGITEKQIEEFEKNADLRTIMIMPYTSYSFIDGKKTKTVTKRDEKHHVIGKEQIEVDNRLIGVPAVLAFLKSNGIEPLCSNTMSVYFNTTKDKLENIEELVEKVGRIIVHRWIPKEEKEEKKKTPTNNTSEVKVAAKKARKDLNKKIAEMRPYYAALRKGGVSKRIKKYNKKLADKIEKWIKERRSAENKKAEKNKEYRKIHRQFTSQEMKANKNARKAIKKIATHKRKVEHEAAAMKKNQAAHKDILQNPSRTSKKAVQQNLNFDNKSNKAA